MKRIIISMVVAIAMMQVSATVQHCEMLNYNGENVQLYSLLLELNDELYRDVKKLLPEKAYSTALWRNYIGHWKIENDSLFLDSIAVFKDNKLKALNIDDLVLKYRLPDGRIFCSWVSDTLRIGKEEWQNNLYFGWDKWNVISKDGIVKQYKSKVIIKGVPQNEITKELRGFPFEKYPNVEEIRFGVYGAILDSKSKIGSYNIEACRITPSQGITEKMRLLIIAEIQDFLKKKKIIPVSVIDDRAYTPYCIISITKDRVGVLVFPRKKM